MKSILRKFCITIFLASLCVTSASAAKLYKWIDENGSVSYQDSPPPSGANIVKEEDITPTTTTAASQQTTSQPVTVYTVENCESCELLLLRLQNWEIPTIEQSLRDSDVQAQILAAEITLQAPTLLIDGKFVSDSSTGNLVSELQQAGYQIEGSVNTEEPSSDTAN